MEINTIINIAIYVAMLVTCILSFIVIRKAIFKIYGKRQDVFERIENTYKSSGTMDYKKMQLSRRGIMFRLKNYDLSPTYYLVLKLTIGFLIGVLAFLTTSKIIAFFVGFVIGYLGVPLYFKYEDKKDNEEMIMDIYNTYANIKTQMSAGIYIREVLEYTYEMVVNPRYKEALAELILNFSDKTISSSESVQVFKNRFQSQEIDKLAALLGSFLQYGLNAHHADDIMVEIQGLIQASTLKQEHDIESKAEAINFLFFTVIIVMVVYMVFSSFSLGGVF